MFIVGKEEKEFENKALVTKFLELNGFKKENENFLLIEKKERKIDSSLIVPFLKQQQKKKKKIVLVLNVCFLSFFVCF